MLDRDTLIIQLAQRAVNVLRAVAKSSQSSVERHPAAIESQGIPLHDVNDKPEGDDD